MLGFSGFFKSRPSSITVKPSVMPVQETSEGSLSKEDTVSDDGSESDDDRRTVRGALDTDTVKHQSLPNGNKEKQAARAMLPVSDLTSIAIGTP